MLYCLNRHCLQRQNPDHLRECQTCQTSLLIAGKYALVRSLKRAEDSPIEVFEAIDLTQPDQHQIIKILQTDSRQHRQRLERERAILEALQWESLIEDVDEPDPSPLPVPTLAESLLIEVKIPGSSSPAQCLVMHKIEGQTLVQWVRSHGKVSQTLALDWLGQIFQILDRLHEANILHRDIKPENLLVNATGTISLIDFGSARWMDEDYRIRIASRETSLGGDISSRDLTIVGTEGYAPIEQLQGKAVPQSDFFAVGRTLIVLLTGSRIRTIRTDAKTGQLLWERQARSIDPPVAQLINQLTAAGVNRRPASARHILQYLQEGLPRQLQRYQILRSPWVRLSGAIVGLTLAVGAYQFSLHQMADFYRGRGEAAQLNQQLEQARQFYEQALGYLPDDIRTLTSLAMICQSLKDDQCAESHYRRVIQLNPHYLPAHYNLGVFYEEQGHLALARQHYDIAARSPDDIGGMALNNLSRLENKQNRFEQAIDLAQRGLTRTDDEQVRGALYKNLGWALWQQDQLQEATKALDRSIQLAPTVADAYCIRAQIKARLKENSNARADWETCLQLNSPNPEVREWRKLLLDRILPTLSTSP